jgi:hypothetical protein
MALVLAAPERPSILNAFRRFLFQNYHVRRAMREVGRTRRLLVSTAIALSASEQANKNLNDCVITLRQEKDALEKQLSHFRIVDPDAKCIFCGAMKGTIKTLQDRQNQRAYVEHTCSVCYGTWPETPIHPEAQKIWIPVPELLPIPVPPGGVRR